MTNTTLTRAIGCFAMAAFCAPAFCAGTQVNGAVVAAAAPVAPEKGTDDIESLRRQLDAQALLVEQYRRRVDELERELGKAGRNEAVLRSGLDKDAPAPRVAPISAAESTALEETLQLKGVALLPAGGLRMNTGLSWSHYGTSPTGADSYKGLLGVDVGLPWATMLSFALPYAAQNYAYGTAQGIGDVSLSLSHKITEETRTSPSVVASVTYTHSTGKHPFEEVSVGSGFRSVSGSVSVLKRVSPVAVYGTFGMGHAYPQYVDTLYGAAFSGRVVPANAYSASLGASLAATPTLSLNMGWSYSTRGGTLYQPGNGTAYTGTLSNSAYLSLGAGFLLTKNLFLDLSVSAGVTRDAWDHIIAISLPYRF